MGDPSIHPGAELGKRRGKEYLKLRKKPRGKEGGEHVFASSINLLKGCTCMGEGLNGGDELEVVGRRGL